MQEANEPAIPERVARMIDLLIEGANTITERRYGWITIHWKGDWVSRGFVRVYDAWYENLVDKIARKGLRDVESFRIGVLNQMRETLEEDEPDVTKLLGLADMLRLAVDAEMDNAVEAVEELLYDEEE